MNRKYSFTEIDWEDCDNDREFEVIAEIPDPVEVFEDNPVRDWIVSKSCSLMNWATNRSACCLAWDEDYISLEVTKPIRRFIYDLLVDLGSEIFHAFYPGSIQDYWHQREFPPCLYPEYHDLPDFGSYPIIKIQN